MTKEAFYGAMLLLGAGAVYLYPTILAAARRHPHVAAVAILNVGLGWTFVGWVVAAAWAATAEPAPKVRVTRRPT